MYNLIKHYGHADVPQKYVQVLFIILLRRVSKAKSKINGNSTIPQILCTYLPTHNADLRAKYMIPFIRFSVFSAKSALLKSKQYFEYLEEEKTGFSLDQKLPKLFWYQVDVERNNEWVKVELKRFLLTVGRVGWHIAYMPVLKRLRRCVPK